MLYKNGTEQKLRPVFLGLSLSAAAASAAAEYDKKSDYNKPDPVVIKKIAKTVVHEKSSVNSY